MKIFFLALFLFFTACSTKNYEHTATKIITIKTPKIKFSDIGYIRHTQDAIELELFIAGHVFKRFHIDHFICVDAGCMSKSSFNQEYLSTVYPDELLQNILLGRQIYKGENILKNSRGFQQDIQTDNVNITYIVGYKKIYFKDKKNHILIKIKELE